MEPIDEPQNIFAELKQIREEKGLKLDEISRESRIQLAYLKAIEDGAFENIPEVYDKFFFQTYLNYLELDDPEQYMQAFKDIRKETFSPTPQTTIRKISIQKENTNAFLNRNILFWAIPIVIIIGIVAFLVWNSKGNISIGSQAVHELPVRQIVKEIEARAKPEKKQSATVTSTTKLKKQVHVNVKALEKTWLRLIRDKKDTSEFLLQVNNSLQFEADSVLRFLVGNASGLDFTINGRAAGVLGKPGEVISYMKITKDGIVAKKNKKIKKGVPNDTLSVH